LGLGGGPTPHNPQSPIPNPQSPIPIYLIINYILRTMKKNKNKKIKNFNQKLTIIKNLVCCFNLK